MKGSFCNQQIANVIPGLTRERLIVKDVFNTNRQPNLFISGLSFLSNQFASLSATFLIAFLWRSHCGYLHNPHST